MQKRESLIEYSSKFLDNNPIVRRIMKVSSAAEFAEKLAFGSAVRAFNIAEKYPSVSPRAEELKRELERGNLDNAVSVSEEIYRYANPDAKIPLVGEIFNSLISASKYNE